MNSQAEIFRSLKILQFFVLILHILLQSADLFKVHSTLSSQKSIVGFASFGG